MKRRNKITFENHNHANHKTCSFSFGIRAEVLTWIYESHRSILSRYSTWSMGVLVLTIWRSHWAGTRWSGRSTPARPSPPRASSSPPAAPRWTAPCPPSVGSRRTPSCRHSVETEIGITNNEHLTYDISESDSQRPGVKLRRFNFGSYKRLAVHLWCPWFRS